MPRRASRQHPGREYAVLLSNASTQVFPDLVCPQRYATPFAADNSRPQRAGGIEHIVVYRDYGGDWFDLQGRPLHDAILARWE